MIILPAIDIIGGKPVRLYQGDYNQSEQVAASVVDTAVAFAKEGAEFLHLVDLDGARLRRPVNQELILQAKEAAGIPAEVGGGIRCMKDIEGYLENGMDRVILGTSALQNPDLLKEALARYPDQIAVGIDAKDGQVMVEGWMDGSGIDYLDFAREMQDLGVKTIIFTDISKDGTLQGPNLDMLKTLKDNLDVQITASGGIRDLSDIEALTNLGVYGAITGKAMYAGTLDLGAAIACGKKEASC